MTLSEEQKAQVKRQLHSHNRESGIKKIILDENTHASIELLIERGVFGSDIMNSGIYLARFLYQHQELYATKDVIDMGCGPGTQGIVMAKYGAKSVVLSDISPKAVNNTRKNIERHNLTNTMVYESDLFQNLPLDKTYDIIVFNFPFFAGEPEKFEGDPNQDEMLRKSMLGGTGLIKIFLQDISRYLKPNGLLIMSHFHFAGNENDPATHAEKYNLKIFKEYKIKTQQGLQLGDFTIYLISKHAGNKI